MSVFIPGGSKELDLIHELCVCMDFVSYGLMQKQFLLELAIKSFWLKHLNTLVTLDSKKKLVSEKFRP